MNRGLVIGKFMPVHKGHLALIEFAASQCDELIVSMSFTNRDPIPSDLRFSWLKELCSYNTKIKVEIIEDNFDDENLDWHERTKNWATVLTKAYGQINSVFSSEPYGEFLADHLQAKAFNFDSLRAQVPISATQIRSHPIKYWDYIPKVVQPFFLVKICFNGPESTGKSVMAESLAKKYQTEFVPEVARELITSNSFTIDDIIKIGKAQIERVKEKTKTATRFLFCDTDLITTQIYSQYYLNDTPEILYVLEKEINYDLYFLFDIDVPWISDGLRDLSDKRLFMESVFQTEITKRGINPIAVKGNWNERSLIIENKIQSQYLNP